MMSKKVPELRFKGFTDDWEERKIKDIFKITRGKVLAATETSEEKSDISPFPVYSSQTKNNGLMGYYKDYLFDTAITWTTDGANAGTVSYRSGRFYSTNVNGVLISDKGYTNKAISEILNLEAWKWVSHVGNPKLMNNVMGDISIMIPSSFEEQDRLSDFLNQLDDTIALHQRKLDLLKEQKKGFLQKMFPKNGSKVPELRFAGFADDWEERKLGDISKVIDPHPSHRAPAATEEGIPFIGIGDVNEVGNINYKTARIVDAKIFDEHHNRYDLSIPSIGIGRVASLGKVIRLRDDIGKYVVSPTMSVIQFTNNNDLDFLYSNMNTPIFQKQFKSFSNGSTRQSVGIQDLRILMVSLPVDIEEQQKIGSFFKQLDNTIALHQRKLDLLKEQKKGFLQKMFV